MQLPIGGGGEAPAALSLSLALALALARVILCKSAANGSADGKSEKRTLLKMLPATF